MNYVLFQPVSETHGFAVEKMQKEYRVIFVRKEGDKLVKEATAYSNGKMHSYTTPFLAGHAIRKDILPLYRKKAA